MDALNNQAKTLVDLINSELKNLSVTDSYLSARDNDALGLEPFERLINKKIESSHEELKERLTLEYFGIGPLEKIMNNEEITEIAINNFDSIWIERNGKIIFWNDSFFSQLTFEHFLKRLFLEIGLEPTIAQPFIDGHWRGTRIHIVGSYLKENNPVRVTIRKHKKEKWTLDALKIKNWCDDKSFLFLNKILEERKNFLVIGPTGTGKTSVLKAMLNQCPTSERIVVIEDSNEIGQATTASTHLMTRFDSRGILPDITLTDLVKQTLRMRPDRLIVGEVRGGEAKDLLMALATGHEGSAGTLHASNPSQALIRLEMLIQMGAPNWSLTAIRKLLALSLDYLIVCERSHAGFRKLGGIYKIAGIEDNGLTIENAINPFNY